MLVPLARRKVSQTEPIPLGEYILPDLLPKDDAEDTRSRRRLQALTPTPEPVPLQKAKVMFSDTFARWRNENRDTDYQPNVNDCYAAYAADPNQARPLGDAVVDFGERVEKFQVPAGYKAGAYSFCYSSGGRWVTLHQPVIVQGATGITVYREDGTQYSLLNTANLTDAPIINRPFEVKVTGFSLMSGDKYSLSRDNLPCPYLETYTPKNIKGVPGNYWVNETSFLKKNLTALLPGIYRICYYYSGFSPSKYQWVDIGTFPVISLEAAPSPVPSPSPIVETVVEQALSGAAKFLEDTPGLAFSVLIGGPIALCLLCALAFFCWRRRQKKKDLQAITWVEPSVPGSPEDEDLYYRDEYDHSAVKPAKSPPPMITEDDMYGAPGQVNQDGLDYSYFDVVTKTSKKVASHEDEYYSGKMVGNVAKILEDDDTYVRDAGRQGRAATPEGMRPRQGAPTLQRKQHGGLGGQAGLLSAGNPWQSKKSTRHSRWFEMHIQRQQDPKIYPASQLGSTLQSRVSTPSMSEVNPLRGRQPWMHRPNWLPPDGSQISGQLSGRTSPDRSYTPRVPLGPAPPMRKSKMNMPSPDHIPRVSPAGTPDPEPETEYLDDALGSEGEDHGEGLEYGEDRMSRTPEGDSPSPSSQQEVTDASRGGDPLSPQSPRNQAHASLSPLAGSSRPKPFAVRRSPSPESEKDQTKDEEDLNLTDHGARKEEEEEEDDDAIPEFFA